MVLEYNLTTIWKDTQEKKFHSEILAIAVSIGAWERSGRQDPSYSEWVDAKELDESLRESVSMSNLSIITCELSVWCKYSCATMPVLLFLSFLFNMVDYIMQPFPFDACDRTPTRCHTRRITYECYLSHGQNSEGIIYLLSLFITSKRLWYTRPCLSYFIAAINKDMC